MGIKFIPLSKAPQEIDKIIKQIEDWSSRNKVNAPRKAGQFMIKLAKRFAPEQSTHVRKNIGGQKYGKGYMVYSKVTNKSVPYNWWLDNRVNRSGVPYPTVQRTGIEDGGYFTKARIETEKYMKDVVIQDVSRLELVK